MELRHYEGQPMDYDPNRTYEQREPRPYGKPNGLWVSVLGEYDWPSWCASEDFYTSGGVDVEHEVTLAETANVLHIDNGDALKDFTLAYGIRETFPGAMGQEYERYAIDWSRVASEYDGLIISPYMYSWNAGYWMEWYYGWDCASGCIWNLSAIESVSVLTPIKEEA